MPWCEKSWRRSQIRRQQKSVGLFSVHSFSPATVFGLVLHLWLPGVKKNAQVIFINTMQWCRTHKGYYKTCFYSNVNTSTFLATWTYFENLSLNFKYHNDNISNKAFFSTKSQQLLTNKISYLRTICYSSWYFDYYIWNLCLVKYKWIRNVIHGSSFF